MLLRRMIEPRVARAIGAAVRLLARAVADRSRQAVLHQQPSLVANRNGLAPARLANDAGGRPVTLHHSARASRSGRLFFNRAYHGQRMFQALSMRSKASS